MEKILINILDVINELDGSRDQIFVYQIKEIQVTASGFKSLVDTNLVYYNMAKQEVFSTGLGFQHNAATTHVQYRCKAY
jgi:hypothetical protein